MRRNLSVLVLLGARGGGDRQPVVALACGLHDRGHEVTVLCDSATERLISPTGLPVLIIPPALDQTAYLQTGFVVRWAQHFEAAGGVATDSVSNPLVDWATAALPVGQEAVSKIKPDLIIGSLFCMGLADKLATNIRAPWCFVNPSFYFGDHSKRRWEQDWHDTVIQRFAENCLLPLAQRADIVLHATDEEFDFQPSQLPSNHHYVGFLLWEPSDTLPDYINQPGDPWALVTVSTAPQREEFTLARSALLALADHGVRTLLTLPDGHNAEELGDIPGNVTLAGYVPHTPVLERSAIVISHAGHGIVSKALFQGVPMVLLPWDRDQPGVAARAKRLGVARVVPRHDVSQDTVGQAVAAVFSEPKYRETASRVASRLKRKDAVEVACRLLERL
jgi:UDP:flavonoid glycosyltransferase YjiC (YdhE family)